MAINGVGAGGMILLVALGCPFLHAALVAAQGAEADVFVSQAILYFEDKQYEAALQELREALASDPTHLQALYYSGLVLMAQLKYDEAIEHLERAQAKAPADLAVTYQLGMAYYSRERYDKAEPLLARVLSERPETENLGYYVGLLRYRQKRYQDALQAFKAETSRDQNIRQLTRFYTGLTTAILGLPELAASELEEAQRIHTASPLTGPADRLRDTIMTARDGERRWHGEVRLGTYYDTNVAVNPLPSGDPTAEQLRTRRTNTPGELAAARLEYTWLRQGSWESSVAYSFFQTFNNKVSFYNVQNNMAALTTSYRGLIGSLPYQLGLQYSYDNTDLRDNQFLKRHSVTLSGALVENSWNLTTLQGRFQDKDFTSSFLPIAQEIRSAQNWMVGLTHVLRFDNDRHLLHLGYQYDKDNSAGTDWSYSGHRMIAGGQYTLPWRDIRLKYDYDLYFRTYPFPNAVFPVDNPGVIVQKVTEQNHIVRVEYPLPNNVTLALDYQGTFSRANLPIIFNYDRSVFTASLSWSF